MLHSLDKAGNARNNDDNLVRDERLANSKFTNEDTDIILHECCSCKLHFKFLFMSIHFGCRGMAGGGIKAKQL